MNLCYGCVTGLCEHTGCPAETPAVTLVTGTALCKACALRAAGREPS